MSDFIGPVTVVRTIKPSYTTANMAKDPLIAALERRYADEIAAAQQVVQDATLAPGGDFIYGSPQQSMAMTKRGILRQQATFNYNRDLPPTDNEHRKDISLNPFYGA